MRVGEVGEVKEVVGNKKGVISGSEETGTRANEGEMRSVDKSRESAKRGKSMRKNLQKGR